MPPKQYHTYFDNPEIWNPAAWQLHKGDRERAHLAAAWMPDEVGSVLDVGCGNGIFTNLAEPGRWKAGVDLSRVALAQVTAPHLQADALHLPVSDHRFDAAVSMEMLEHIPVREYETTLNELLRVTRRYILITVPYNEKLEHNHVVCPVCRGVFHPYHHVRQFQQAAFNTLFGPHSRLLRLEGVVPAQGKALPALWNILRMFFHRQGRNFPTGTVCPQCGFTSKETADNNSKKMPTRSLRHSLSRLWPRRATYTWWMALYERGN
jgi:ubiquinone/menaquinone biosynthesis C-methylase UbiE